VGPVFFFALPSLKQRAQFCIASAATRLIGFGNALFSNARAVVDAVFLYPGLRIHTSSGITTWGLNNLLPGVESIPPSLRLGFLDFNEAIADYNTVICLAPIFVFAWLRRRERTGVAIAASVAGGLSLFYGLTSFWAFQYLAWAVPFWLLSSRWFAVSASLFATLYIYGAYVWLTGDPALLGAWDFIGKPDWPGWLIAVRNLANAFFLVAGCSFLIRAIAGERAHRGKLAA
jgi:hypothetical protein